MVDKMIIDLDLLEPFDMLSGTTLTDFQALGGSSKLISEKWVNQRVLPGSCVPEPSAVRPLHEEHPIIFLFTSTNPQTLDHLKATASQMAQKGLQVRTVPGLDGERAPGLDTKRDAWRRAMVAWGLQGLPYIRKCADMTDPTPPFLEGGERKWYILAEDSCKLYEHVQVTDLRMAAEAAPPGIQIIQAGCRRLNAGILIKGIDLETMQLTGKNGRVRKVTGQKLLLVTKTGLTLLSRRLLFGPPAYFDTCVAQMMLANVAMRLDRPLAGSRAHYSLVDGGKSQGEEMPI
jgi:hypothetical protein